MKNNKKTSLINLSIGFLIFVGAFIYILLHLLNNEHPNLEDVIEMSIQVGFATLIGFTALSYYCLYSSTIRNLLSKSFWSKLDIVIKFAIFTISSWYLINFFYFATHDPGFNTLVLLPTVASITIVSYYSSVSCIIRIIYELFF